MELKKGDYAKYEYSDKSYLPCRIISIDYKLGEAHIAVAAEKGIEKNPEEVKCPLSKIKK